MLACLVFTHLSNAVTGIHYPMLHELLADSRYIQKGTASERVFEGPPAVHRTRWTIQTTTTRYTFRNSSPVPTSIYNYTAIVPTLWGWLGIIACCASIIMILRYILRKLF